MFIMNGYDRKANTWCPWTSCCILYSKQRINASRCMGCYPTIIGKEFLLSLLAVTSNEAKMLSLKIGLLSLGVYYVAMVLATGRTFCILQRSVSRCIACYPTTIDKDFLLWIVARLPPMSSHLKWVSQVYK